MAKKTPRQKLVKELDSTVSEIIKKRDHKICQKCGKLALGSNCHWSHVIPRSKGNALRWDLQNSIVLCMRCHLHWWHKNPLESARWFEETFPDRHKYLMEHKNTLVQFKVDDLEELLEQLKLYLSVM